MLKASMVCTRIHHVGPCQLPNTPETLEHGTVNNLAFPVVKHNEAVDRVPNLSRPSHYHYSARRLAREGLLPKSPCSTSAAVGVSDLCLSSGNSVHLPASEPSASPLPS